MSHERPVTGDLTRLSLQQVVFGWKWKCDSRVMINRQGDWRATAGAHYKLLVAALSQTHTSPERRANQTLHRCTYPPTAAWRPWKEREKTGKLLNLHFCFKTAGDCINALDYSSTAALCFGQILISFELHGYIWRLCIHWLKKQVGEEIRCKIAILAL